MDRLERVQKNYRLPLKLMTLAGKLGMQLATLTEFMGVGN
jgi:hypothetical protein